MDKFKHKLTVPPDRSRRQTLIGTARSLAQTSDILPPASMDQLEEMAGQVLSNAKGLPDEQAFAMLMFNNELWRDHFEATPFNRRLLLLPRCLSNSQNCMALTDELGLICTGCQQCPLNDLLSEAENLGYKTLVAEGTTSALALVEEGSVEAILGTGCMESLLKSFDILSRSALPSIAVPLLSNGCHDTKVDQDWLKEQIRSERFNPAATPLSLWLIGKQVEKLFTQENLSRYFKDEKPPVMAETLALQQMIVGGKRMRPLLSLLSYSAYARTPDPLLIEQLMVAIECFHKASLIHDDIEDHDEYRYNKKTLHHEQGIPQAINTGDYLVGQGYHLLGCLPLPPERIVDLLRLFAHRHLESTKGQGEDLIQAENRPIASPSVLDRIFEQKTGSAIEVALLSGIIAANGSQADRPFLQKFACQFGRAYQIRDDLNEFSGTATDQKKASYPYLKSHFNETISHRPASEEDWHSVITANKIDQMVRRELETLVEAMKTGLNALSSPGLRIALLGLINQIFTRS